MGELDSKPFVAAMKRCCKKDVQYEAVEMCSLWNKHIRDPHWYPFKVIEVEGKSVVWLLIYIDEINLFGSNRFLWMLVRLCHYMNNLRCLYFLCFWFLFLCRSEKRNRVSFSLVVFSVLCFDVKLIWVVVFWLPLRFYYAIVFKRTAHPFVILFALYIFLA